MNKKLMIEESRANAEWEIAEKLSDRNLIKKKEIDFRKEAFEKEQSAKDRVDISLNEYKKLTSENESLKRQVSDLEKAFRRMCDAIGSALYGHGKSLDYDEIWRKMLEGELKAEAQVIENIQLCETKIAVIYTVRP